MNIKSKFVYIFLIFVTGCSFSPGMYMDTNSTWLTEKKYVYIPSIDKNLEIFNIKDSLDSNYKNKHKYRIGNGDQIAVRIWGLPDIFPTVGTNPDDNLRRVDSNGNIFFPYVGLIPASGMSQDELRVELTKLLENYFNEPQVDVTIARFNSQQAFILGEVTKPLKINLTDIPVSLSDAIGESFGLNINTASGSEVYIIRQKDIDGNPKIFYADLKSPSGFIDAGNFYLLNNDIVYVNSSGTTRWNRVVSQFFPFSTFLNSVDNLTSD